MEDQKNENLEDGGLETETFEKVVAINEVSGSEVGATDGEIYKFRHINNGRYSGLDREYTVCMSYNLNTKIAKFGLAIVHPEMDVFTKEEGRNESYKALKESPFLLIDFSPLIGIGRLKFKKEMKIVNKQFNFVSDNFVSEIMFTCFINK